MRKSKKHSKIAPVISGVLGTLQRLHFFSKKVRRTTTLPKLLTIRQTADLLGVHPNTLRSWDQHGKLRAVRIGTRHDRRYDSDQVRALQPPTRITSRGASPRYLRPLVHWRPLAGLIVAGACVSLLSQFAAFGASPSTQVALTYTPSCTGWHNSSAATSTSTARPTRSSDLSNDTAAFLSFSDVAVQTGQTNTSQVDAAQDVLTCENWTNTSNAKIASISSPNIGWNMTIEGTPNTTDAIEVEYSHDGTNWNLLTVVDLSDSRGGHFEATLPGDWSVDQLKQVRVRFHPDAGVFSPFHVHINHLQADTQATLVPPPVSVTTDAEATKNLDKLVSFSQQTYQESQAPLVTIPKHQVKRFLFVKTQTVDWKLQSVSLTDGSQHVSTPDTTSTDQSNGDQINTQLNIDTNHLSPGKYFADITMVDSAGRVAKIQRSFLWGVVALDFRRASPQPGELEEVGVGILDDKGRTICDANLTIKVQDPHGHTLTYSSNKHSIASNPNCIDKGITNEPDYHFSFTPRLSGTYHVSLQAKTKVGQRTYEDNLFVANNQAFDVQRIDYPTRINPYAGYPVRITVTPHQDYSGQVYERVPANFKLYNVSSAGTIQDDVAHPGMKRITWDVQWKKESTYYLSYKFVAPQISPALFQTGPLSIGGNDLEGAAFIEPRQWQIASDSISAVSWTGAVNGNWSNGGNWSTGAIPQAGDNLVFPAGAANYSNTNDLGENYWFNTITFNDTGYTLSGNTIILGQGQNTNSVILPGIVDAVSSGGNTIALPVRLDATRLITVSNSGETLTISGAITGIGGLSKEGPGKMILSGGNTYSGVTKVNGGVLNCQNSACLGTIAGGTEVVGEAALELQGTIAIGREALTLRGYGVSSSGALRNIANSNSWDGLITIAGTTEIDSDSGTLTLNGGVTGTFNLNLDGASSISFAKAPIAIGAGLLTKNGSGTTTFNFPNTYTGLTTVNAGTLLYGCDNAMLAGGITVNGGTLDMSTYSDMQGTVTLGTLAGGAGTITGTSGVLSSASFVVYAGTISAIIAGDGGTLAKSTPGTVTLTRPNLFTGATTVTVGILKIQDSLGLGTIDGTTTVSTGATLQIDGTGLTVPEYISVAGLGLNNMGALVNSTGSNTMTGQITLTAATTIEAQTGSTMTIATGGVTGAFALTVDGDGNTTFSTGPIATTTGALLKNGNGTLTIQTYCPYTGATTVNDGTLTLNGSGSIVLSSSITVATHGALIADNSSVNTDRIGDTATMTMNGGDFDFYGSTTTNVMGTVGALTFAAGQSSVNIHAGTGGSTILRFASFARTAGASGIFRGPSLGSTPAANVATLLFTTAPTLVGDDGVPGTPTVSIMQGIFGDNSTAGSGTDMVTYGRGNNYGVRLLNGGGFSNEYTTDMTMTNANVKISAPTTAVTTQINSLILGSGASITDAGSAKTITFMSGNILNLASGTTIAGTNTTLAGGAVEFIVRTPVNLDIQSNITTTGGLSKSGTGTLTYSTVVKGYTGLTAVNSGTLLYGINDAISTGAVTVDNGTLDMATYTDTVGAVTCQGGTITGTTGVLSGSSYSFRDSTISAILGGSGGVTVVNTGANVDAVTTITRNNTFTGLVTASSGILKLGGAGDGTNTPFGTSAGGITVGNGATLDLNGYTLSTSETTQIAGLGIASQGAIINSSSTPVTLNSSGAITINAASRIGADFGKITITGGINSGSNFGLTVGGFGDIEISGAITVGTGTVTKDGFGTYTPSNGNSSYSGATTISAGTLKLGAISVGGTNSPLGIATGATAVTAGATLDLNGFSLGIAEPITNLNGTGSGTGDFAAGALINSSASSVSWTGTITLGAASTIKAPSGAITLSAITGAQALTLGGSGTGTVSGVFGAGAATLNKIDTGTWTMSGVNTYTGASTIYQGTIKFGVSDAAGGGPLGTAGTGTTVYSGGVIDMNGFNSSALAEALTINGFGVSNGGALVNNSGSVTFLGARTLGSDTRITSGTGTMTLSGTSAGVFETRLGGAGNFTLSGAWAATAATVWKDGAGNATASVAQGWTGNTTVIAGTMTDGALNGLSSGNVIVDGGTFDLSTANADTVGAVWLIDGTISSSGGSSAILTGTAYTFESGTVSGILAGAVAVVKNTAGSVSITGAETISSTMTINAGSVIFSGNGTAVSVTAITVNLGGTLTLDNSGTAVASRILDTLVLTMNGGNLNFKGNPSGVSSETMGQLLIAAGHNIVTVTPGAGGSTTLTFGAATSFSRTNGATVLFRGTSLGATAAANVSTIKFTTAPGLNGGGGNSGTNTVSILKGAYGDSSLSGNGTDMVTYTPPTDTSTSLRLLTAGEYVSNSFATANANVKITTNTAAATSTINSIIINGGDITNPGTAQTITTSAATTGVAGNVLVLSANNIAGANTTIATTNAIDLTVLANANSTISALIGNSSTGNLVVSGSSTVTLSGANTYTGTTFVNNAATITAGASNVISTGGVTVVGGTYNLNGNSDSIGAISMTGGTIASGAGTLTTTSTLTTVANANVPSKVSGTLAVPTAATITVNDGLVEDDANISAVITSASTSLTKAGTGVLVLGGSSTYTGSTLDTAGTIKLGAAGGATNTPLGTTAAGTTVSSGAALDLNGYSLGTTEGLTISGTGLTANAKGAILNTTSTAATYQGLVALGAAATIESDYGTINISSTNGTGITGTGFALTLRGAGNGTLSTGVNTSTSGSVVKNDLGTWTVSGDGNYTGVTTITLGVLKLGAAGGSTNNPLGTTGTNTTIASGAMLDLNGFTLGTAEPLSINGTGIANAGAVTTSSGSATSYSGAITLAAASRITNFGAGTFSINGNITGATFILTAVNAPGTITQGTGSVWSGTSTALTKEGYGTTILSGQNTFTTGVVTVSSGTLQLGANGGAINTPLGTAAGGVTVAAGAVFDFSTFVNTLSGAAAWETFTINGSGINNGGALILNSSTENDIGTFTLGSNARTKNSGAGSFRVITQTTGAFNLGVMGTGQTWLNSNMSTAGTSITKFDSGTLLVDGSLQTYTGLIRINGGTFQYGSSNAINTNNVEVAGGTLDFNGQTDSVGTIKLISGTITDSNVTPGVLTGTTAYTVFGGTISGVLGGGGTPLNKSTGATVSITKTQAYTNLTTVLAGTLQYGASDIIANAAAVTINGGTLDVGSNSDTLATVTLTSGYIIGSGTLTGSAYNVMSGSISAILAGAVNLTKTTTGTVTLSGTNTFTGVTTISGGTISVGTIGNGGVAGNLGQAANTSSNLIFNTGTGTLAYTGSTASTDRNIQTTLGITLQIDVVNPATTLTWAGSTTATTAPLTKIGPGTLIISGTNLNTGTTTVLAGVLQLGSSTAMPVAALTVTNGTFDLNNNSESVAAITISKDAQIIDSGGSTAILTTTAAGVYQSGTISARIGGSVASAFTKSTTDRVILSGDNTHTSTAVTLSAGALNLQSNNALGASGTALLVTETSGAVIETQNTITVPSTKTFNISGTGVNVGGAIENVADSNTLAGAITLGASGVRINSNSGTLTLNGAMSGSGNAVTFGGAANIIYGGVIGTVAGTVTKDGAGTFSPTNTNTYTGLTTVSAGILVISTAQSTGTTAGGVTVASGAAVQMTNSTTVGVEALGLSGTGISNAGALDSTSGTNVWQGAVTLNATSSIGVDLNSLSISGSITGGAGIGLTKVGAASLTIATTTLGGDMNISAGTLVAAGSSAIGVAGNWTNSGTFTANTSTVTLNGTAQQAVSGTLTGSTGQFNNLIVTNAFGNGTTTWSVTFAGSAQTAATFTATTASTKLQFNAGSTYTFQNISFNGQASGTRVFLRSSSGGSAWNLLVAGTQSVLNTDVMDSNATGSASVINASGGTNLDSTGNTYWNFTTSGMSLSGFIYTNDATTALDCSVGGSRTVAVKINGAGSATGTCSLNTGAYTISSLIVGAGDVLTVFISGATEKAATVTYTAGTGNISNLFLRVNRLVVTQESGTAMTNNATTGLGIYDKDNDSTNLFYTANSNNLSVDAGKELLINAGKTYTPGGTVTTATASNAGNADGDLVIQTGATMNMGTNALSIGGDIFNSGNLNTTAGQTTTLSATAGGFTISAGASFQNLTLNGSGGGFTNAGTMTVNGDFVLTAGSFTQTNSTTISVFGSQFTLANGTTWNKATSGGNLILDNATGISFADNNATKQDLGAVQIGNSPGTTTLTTDMSATTVTVATGDTFNTKGYDVTTSGAFAVNGTGTLDLTDTAPNNEGDGTILDVGGDFTMSSSATFTSYSNSKVFLNSTSGANTNRTWTTGGKAYNDVELKNAGTSNDQVILSGNLDVNGTFTLTDGTIKADTNNPNTNTSGNVVIAITAAYTKGSGVWTFDGSGTNTWTDSTGSGGQDLGSVSINGSSKTVNIASSAKATKLTIAGSQTFGLGSSGYTFTLTGSGTGVSAPFQNSGALNEGSNSTFKFTGTANTDLNDEDYYNLTIAPSGAGSPTYVYGADQVAGWTVAGLLTVGDGTNAVYFNTDVDETPQNMNDLTVNSNATWEASNINGSAIAGSLVMNGTVVNEAAVGFYNTTSGHTISGTTLTSTGALQDATFNGSGGGWTIQSNADIGLGIGAGATVIQDANINLTVEGNTTIASGGTFTKASGTGTVTFIGTAARTFTDSNTTKQDLGNVLITKTNVTSSNNKITLGSSMLVDTLTISANNTLDLANVGYTLTVANIGSTATPLVVTGNLTPNSSSTVQFTATNNSGNISVPSQTYASLDCSPSATEICDILNNTTATDTLTVGSNGTVAIASTKTLTLSKNTATSLVLNGATSGTGALVYQNSATTVTTSGTLGSGFTFDLVNGNETIPNRTFGGLVTALNTTASARTALIAASSTPTFTGLDLKTTGAGTLLFDAATNNPTTVTVTGNVTNSAASGAVTLSMGSGNWAVSGNFDLTNVTTFNNNSGTLTMTGTGTLTSNGKTLFNVTTSGSGAVTLASATHTLAGNLTLGSSATITPGTSTVVMSGASKTIDGGGQTLYNLTINAATTLQNTDLTISNTISIAASTTFTNTGRTLTDIGTAITFGNSTSTLGGTGTLRFTDASTGVGGTGGSITCVTRYDASNADITSTHVTSRVYKNRVEFYSNSNSNHKVTTASGSFTVSTVNGQVKVMADGSGSMTLDMATNNGVVSGSGGLAFGGSGGGAKIISQGSGNLTFNGGDVNFTNGTYNTVSTSTLVISGSNLQTLTPAGVTLQNFNNSNGVNGVTLPTNGAVTIAGNYVGGTGVWIQSNETITMSGTANTFDGGSNAFTNVIFDPATTGTITLLGDMTVTGTATIATGDTLALSTGSLWMGDVASTLALNGTISSSGGSVYYESGNTFPTTGTITAPVWFIADNNIDMVVPARTFGGYVEFDHSFAAPHTYTLGTAGGQTINFNGGVLIGSDDLTNVGNVTVTGATWNPTINVTGDVKKDTGRVGAATLTIVGGTGTWTVTTGNVDFTGITYTATSGNTLRMNGTSKTLTTAGNALHHFTVIGGSVTMSGTTTVNGDLSVSGGTLVAPASGALNVAGNFTNSSIFTHNSSTVTMSGTSVNLNGSTTFNNLTISGSVSVASGSPTVNALLVVNTSKSLSIGSGLAVTLANTGASALTLSGTINGPGRLIYRSSTAFPTTGALGSTLILRYDMAVNNMTTAIRTDYGSIEAYNDSGASRTLTLGAGTHTLAGNFDLQSNAAASPLIVAGNTNNPAMNVGGNVTTSVATSAVTYSMGSNTWTVGGNFDLTSVTTLNNNAGTLTMNGTGTLTTNGLTVNNFTTTGSGTITFANATHALAGNLTIGTSNTITPGTSTINMTGSGKTIDGGGKTIAGLTISGNTTIQTNDLIASGTLSIGNSTTLTITSVTLTNTGSSAVSWGTSSVITGTGKITFTDVSGGPSTGGTLSSQVVFDATAANIASTTFTGRTYGNTVWLYSGSGSARSITAAASGYTFSGAVTTLAGGAGVVTANLGAATGTTTISGALTIGATTSFTAPAATLSCGSDFTNNGTFTHNSGTVSFTTNNNTTFTGSTTFNNLTITDTTAKTVSFVHATTTTVSGTFTVTGAAGQLVTLTRDNTSNWSINPTTASVDYVDVSYSTNTGTSICATHSISTNGGNSGWSVTAGTSCGITISGHVYSDEGTTPYLCATTGNLTIAASTSGQANTTGTCTADTGAYSLTATAPLAGGDPVIVFISAGGAVKGSTATVAIDTSSAITVDIYQNRLTLTHETAGPMTNATLATGYNGDSNMQFITSASNITVSSGVAVLVKSGKTYTASGTITTNTTGGDLRVAGTATIDTGTSTIGGNVNVLTGATLTISGTTIVKGGGMSTAGTGIIATSGTPTVTVRGTGNIGGGSGAITFYNLTVGDGTGTATTALASNATVTNILNTGASSQLTINSGITLTDSGTTDVSNSGTITGSTGTLTFTSASTGGPGTGGTISSIVRYDATGANIPTAVVDARTYGGDLELYSNVAATRSITLIGSTYTVSGNLKIITGASQSSVLTVTGSAALAMNVTGNLSYTKGGAATPAVSAGTGTWTITGNMNTTNGTWSASTGTVALNGSSSTLTSGVSFYNLTISGTGVTTATSSPTVSHTLTVSSSNQLTIGAGLFVYASAAATVSLSGTITGTTGTLVYENASTLFNAGATTGTISSILEFFPVLTSAITIPARTYAGDVICSDSGTAATTCTFAAGTQAINGNFLLQDIGDGVTIDAATNNPTVTIGKNFSGSFTGGGIFGTMGTGTWTVSGDFDLSSFATLTQDAAGTLVMDGNVGSATLTPGAFTMGNVTLTPGNTKTVILSSAANLTLAGSLVLGGAGTLNTTGSTVVMGGSAKTITGGSKTLNNLTINDNTTVQTSALNVGGTLTVASTKTLTITGVTLTDSGTTDVSNAGTISGTGTLTFTATTTGGPGTGGTINCIVRFDASGGSIGTGVLDARTYGGDLELYSNVAAVRTITFLGSASYTVSGNMKVITGSSQSSSFTVTGGASMTLNVTGDLTFTKGGSATPAITSGNNSWNMSGNVTTTNGTWTSTSGNNLNMNGNTTTLNSSATFYNITINGTPVSISTSSPKISHTLAITSGKTLTINTQLNTQASATISMSGATINGSGTLVYQNSATPTLGTFNANITFSPDTGTITIPSTTFGGNVTCTDSIINPGVCTMSGTTIISGNLVLSDVNNGTTLTSSGTPTVTVGGMLSVSTNISTTLTIAGTWSVAGNIDLSPISSYSNTGTLVLNGSSQQTLTTGGILSLGSLTVTNASGSNPDTSPSVIFADSVVGGGTLTAATNDVKLRFTAGSTYAWSALNLSGTSGHYVTVRSSTPGTAVTFNVGAGSRTVTYASLKDNNACGSTGGFIDASDGTNQDLTNTSCWNISVLSFSISDNTIGFGSCLSSAARYATGDGSVSGGSSADSADAHTLSVTTDANHGYAITVYGSTLTSGLNSIAALGGSATASSPGSEQFGLRAVLNSGSGSVSAPFNTSNWAHGATSSPQILATYAGSVSNYSATYGLRYICNISSSTPPGAYAANLTYVVTPTF